MHIKTYLSCILAQEFPLLDIFNNIETKADTFQLTFTHDQLLKDATLEIDVLTATYEQAISILVSRIDTFHGPAWDALGTTFSIHGYTDTAICHTVDTRRGA